MGFHRDAHTGQLHMSLRPATGPRTSQTAPSPFAASRPYTAATTQSRGRPFTADTQSSELTTRQGVRRGVNNHTSSHIPYVHMTAPEDSPPFVTALTAGWGFAGDMGTPTLKLRKDFLVPPRNVLGPERRIALALWRGDLLHLFHLSLNRRFICFAQAQLSRLRRH